ncbi:alpha-2-macroglobulin-like isoform X1 [Anguilla anguilla]|uniref:alpha-2-macroglobulin-like isoform X1 n=1 Tax=Anguilla anguilla TaxID=7936 RepID=UPI0015AAECD5|nr:alpha-2-macroglobulin-like isoform X1 [Anguilla anguilla]
MLGLLLIACVLLHAAKSRQPDEPIYLVTVTSQTKGGSTETICAHIVLQKEPLSFMLTLEIGASSTTLLEELITAEFHRCVKFQVPPVVTETTATIQASIKGEETCLSKKTKILIKPSSSLTIIQTDKPIYKPGQTIKFRIVSLDSSFLLHEQMYQTVELQDPNSNRIAQWLNQSVTTGIMDLSHPTTPEAKQGIYTISAWTKRGIMTIQTFEIIEYVLPKFEVTVHLPDAIFSQDREVTVKICGKYTYGKPVLGSVKAEVCRKFPAFYGAYFGSGVCMTYTMRTDKTGCATNIINATSFLPAQNPHQSLTVECEMEEDGTGVVLKGSGSTQIVRGEISLEFQDTPSTFKQGINYDGKIIIKGPPSSIANKTIFLHGPQASMWTLTSDSEGVAHFSLDTSSWLEEYVQLQAHCNKESAQMGFVFGAYDRCYASHTAYLFYSKSMSFLSIQHAKEPLPCDQDGQVLARYIIRGQELKKKKTLDFFYLVLSKGSIVQYGHSEVTLNAEEGDVLLRRTECGTVVKRGEFSFSLQQTEDLAPYAQVVVYTVLPNGEVVADNFNFPVQLCFKNKVSLQFSSSQELPGEKAFLQVQAKPGSLCSLRAIDQSVLLMRPEKELNAQKVYETLPVQKLFGYPYAVQDSDPPPCLSPFTFTSHPGQRFHPIPQPGFLGVQTDDVFAIFRAVGVKALTNSNMKKPVPCFQYGGPMGLPGLGFGQGGGAGVGGFSGGAAGIPARGAAKIMPQLVGSAGPLSGSAVQAILPPKETIRTFFPETWIWELVPVGDSGRVTVEQTVPDTITKWGASGFCTSPAGFGLATSTSLTAFQPFFVSLTLPYSVIREEVFPLKATVFNYLSKCIMVHVSLKESAQFTGQPCDGCQYRRCLCGEESETFTWVVTATTLGRVNITVSAEALSTEELCGNEVVILPERGQIDTVVRTLLVEPEGTEQTISHNALLCPQEGAVEKVISLELPEVFVEGSAKASLSVLGDLMGRAMRNLDSLLAMPYGCGEQNMLLFAPNIYILRYLETTEQLTPEIKSKAITFLESGYQRELNYKHNDGSYSAFGQRDASGNTWLTAFVMKSFGGATRYIFIDPKYITSAKVWLSLQQQEDGCIKSVGKLFHNGMKGGVSDEVMLTAYVTAALLELGTNSTDPMVNRSLACLRQASDQISSTYATALLSYTFTLAGDSVMRARLIDRLDKVAIITEQGRHWKRVGASGEGSLAVEMTSYVLLALLSGPPLSDFDLGYATSIVRWLANQQNPYGGFSSTQNTVVALQALTLYAAATFRKGGASTVTVTSTGGYKSQFHVDEHNRLLYQEEQLQEVPGVYNIKANGEACAFVQIALQYNIPPPPDFSSFTISANATGVCNSARKTSLTVFVHVRYNGGREETNMVIISIRLLSGFLLDKSSLIQLKAHPSVKRVEEEEGHVIIYLDELKKMAPMSYFLVIVEDIPVRNLKPAVVKVYDYYDKSDEAVSEYSSPCAQSDDLNQL